MTHPITDLTVRARAYLAARPGDPARHLMSELIATVGELSTSLDVARTELDVERIDPVTGLPGRRVFTARAQLLATRPGAAVVLFDLNVFKPVNDRYGHGAGDAVLAAVGQRVGWWLRPGELGARLGGDEFALVVVDPEGTMAARLDDLAGLIALPVEHGGARLRVTASFGAACLADHPDLSTAMNAADRSMLGAKGRGRRGRAVVRASRAQARLRLLHARTARLPRAGRRQPAIG